MDVTERGLELGVDGVTTWREMGDGGGAGGRDSALLVFVKVSGRRVMADC